MFTILEMVKSVQAIRRAFIAERARANTEASRTTVPAEEEKDDSAAALHDGDDAPYAVSTEELQAVIDALGFKDYLLTLNTNLRAANTTVSRTAEMLRFQLVLAQEGAVVAAFVALDTTRVLSYLKHLKERLLRSNSTVYNILLDIKSAYEWAIMLQAPEHLATGIYTVTIVQMKRQLKVYRKKKKADCVKIR